MALSCALGFLFSFILAQVDQTLGGDLLENDREQIPSSMFVIFLALNVCGHSG